MLLEAQIYLSCSLAEIVSYDCVHNQTPIPCISETWWLVLIS